MTEPVAPITDAELAAVVEAVGRMTPGPWDFHDPQIRAKELHRIIAPVRGVKKVSAAVAVIAAGLRSNAEMDANGEGIVTLRNHFAAIVARLNEEQARRDRAEALLRPFANSIFAESIGDHEDIEDMGVGITVGNCRAAAAHLASTGGTR